MMRDLDLRTLEVGDEVVVVSGGWRARVSPTQTVTKIGKRDVVLSGGMRFNVNTGREVGSGSSFSYNSLARPNDEEVLAIHHEAKKDDARNAMRNQWDQLWKVGTGYTQEDLDAMRASLDAAEKLL